MNTMKFARSLSFMFPAALVAAENSVRQDPSEPLAMTNRPNVLIPYADDMGVGDVSYGDSKAKIQTPNIDPLASQGMSFTDGHSSSVICTPSHMKINNVKDRIFQRKSTSFILALFCLLANSLSAYSNTPAIQSFVVEERLQGEAGVEQIVLEIDVTHDENYEVQFNIIEGNGIITSYGNWAIFEDTGPGQYVFEAIVTDRQGAIAKDTASYEVPYVNSSNMYFDSATWIKAIGKKTYSFVKRDPSLPDVLIIGDSISVGYTSAVRKKLAGIANVYRIPENGGDTQKALNRMNKWLAGHPWDVVCFNSGLHDLKYTLDGKINNNGTQVRSVAEYKTNLKKEVELLMQSGAKLLWTHTTVIPEGAKGRVSGDAIIYNNGALEVLEDYPSIAINDLYTISKNNPEGQQPANVHFTDAGYEKLGDETATNIESLLKASTKR